MLLPRTLTCIRVKTFHKCGFNGSSWPITLETKKSCQHNGHGLFTAYFEHTHYSTDRFTLLFHFYYSLSYLMGGWVGGWVGRSCVDIQFYSILFWKLTTKWSPIKDLLSVFQLQKQTFNMFKVLKQINGTDGEQIFIECFQELGK